MIEIVTLQVGGIFPAMHGMRNPMSSWAKGDTFDDSCVGIADKTLSKKLSNAGDEHGKHLRMVMVWADIVAPRYWWQQFDTYRIGVEKNSCSTMHKLTAKPLTSVDFNLQDAEEEEWLEKAVIPRLNLLMEAYKAETDEVEKYSLWKKLINELPQGYYQRRTVMMSYAALRNMYHQRKGHKLKEWWQFCEWCEELPESWMITEGNDA